jgi:fructose-1-phosphate kinase PfkB-like protein
MRNILEGLKRARKKVLKKDPLLLEPERFELAALLQESIDSVEEFITKYEEKRRKR